MNTIQYNTHIASLVMVMFFSFTAIATNSRAQCPTDIHPTPLDSGYMYVPWTSDTIHVVDPLFPNCEYDVIYCYRILPDWPCGKNSGFNCTTIQRAVISVSWTRDCNQHYPDSLLLLNKIVDSVFHLPLDTTTNCLGAAYPRCYGFTPACWVLETTEVKYHWHSCGGSAKCVMICDLCDGFNAGYFNCTWNYTAPPPCPLDVYFPPDTNPYKCILLPCGAPN